MELLVMILKKTEVLDDLLKKFSDIGIQGATILDSTGMASQLALNHDEDIQWLGSLRAFLNPEKEKSKTIIAVVREEEVMKIKEETVKVIDFTKPNTGIMFTVPINKVFGGTFNK